MWLKRKWGSDAADSRPLRDWGEDRISFDSLRTDANEQAPQEPASFDYAGHGMSERSLSNPEAYDGVLRSYSRAPSVGALPFMNAVISEANAREMGRPIGHGGLQRQFRDDVLERIDLPDNPRYYGLRRAYHDALVKLGKRKAMPTNPEWDKFTQ